MKYFFDTSAIVKIYHREDGTDTVLDIYRGKSDILVSSLSTIETSATFFRKYRERELDSKALQALLDKFDDDMRTRYQPLGFSSLIIEEASSLLAKFAKDNYLRTLDALQFAFFSTYADTGDTFVSSDLRLAKLLRDAGHTVCTPGQNSEI